MLPLLLGLGLLAGNEVLRQRKVQSREEDMASQYRGLLGQAGGYDMGPPTEGGTMGYQGGSGLLADPGNVQNQMRFAAGIAGLPGQGAQGLNMLNAAMGRAQQQQAQDVSAGQWERNFGRLQAGDAANQANADRSFDLQRDQYNRQGEQWGQSFGLQQSEAQRQAQQWAQSFGLQRQQAAAANAARAGKGEGEGLPKLPGGYAWRQDGIAQPIP
ncbi:MAG: hypothetical protein ACRC1H_10500, partial [Caldilineaceae bacterium]